MLLAESTRLLSFWTETWCTFEDAIEENNRPWPSGKDGFGWLGCISNTSNATTTVESEGSFLFWSSPRFPIAFRCLIGTLVTLLSKMVLSPCFRFGGLGWQEVLPIAEPNNEPWTRSMFRRRKLSWSVVPMLIFCGEACIGTSLTEFLESSDCIRRQSWWCYQNNHSLLIARQ